MLDIINRLKYQVLSEGLDLNTIPRHKLLPLFKERDDVMEEVVDSMILELLLGLKDISYSYHQNISHHFVIHKKGDYGSTYKERLKFTKEELAKIHPLELLYAAFVKSDYNLMRGVKDSPFVRNVCAYLYDRRLVELEGYKVELLQRSLT